MPRKPKRRRPDSGMYEDEHFRVDAVPTPGDPVLEIYSKPYHKLLFKATRLGLLFRCKRHDGEEHLLSWGMYDIRLLGAPLYHVTCMDGRTVIHALNVLFSDKSGGVDGAYNMCTLENGEIELIDKISDALTSKDGVSG